MKRMKEPMNRYRYYLSLFFILSVFCGSTAQVPFSGYEKGSDYERGLELFRKEKYTAAIRFLDASLVKSDLPYPADMAEVKYYRALSSLRLFNPDSEYRMIGFIRSTPESPRINEAYLELGDYFYQNKNYRKAAFYYEEVNRQELSQAQLPAYYFRTGYSRYMTGNKPGALLMFSEIKDIDTEYTPPALYYFSHIAYEDKMYQTAMDGFQRLREDETFGAVVPFYIVQILYIQKDYDQILKMAPELLASAPKERAVELYRFIGDAYFNKGLYSDALPYLEKFAAGTKISAREDKYQLGYCYYKTGDLDKAIKIFLEIGSRGDLLSQNIWFLLGDSYLQKGDKKRAQFGFAEASKTSFDRKIQEDALFNYAKITYETSYSPFGEAIASFQEFINLFPSSDKIEEAYNYLVATYTQMKNYRAALASLDRIRTKTATMEEAYQRVAFYRGLELFKNLDLDEAVDMLEKSLEYGKYNRQIRARAVYWRAEAWYRLGRYEEAKTGYTEFMGIPGSMLLPEYNMVRYNLGYTLYNLEDYLNAIPHLKTFEAGSLTAVRPELIADARNRIADCYFITTSYPQAIEYYDKVIDYGRTDADYAMFQKAFCLGLMKDERGKAEVLSTLSIRYPGSGYLPRALFERGRAYVVLNDFQKGEADFNAVINSFPTSPYVPQAIVQLGLLYYNTGENDKAVAQFRKVIENYKSTPEARYAMTGLKNTYIEMNDVESYFAYIKTLQGYGDVNLAEKDSLLYASGENLYISGRYDRAGEIFSSYLNEFPQGSFRLNANFYLAECLSAGNKTEEALKLYTLVSSEPNNQFTEQALESAARISFDKEEYIQAYSFYENLEKAATGSQVRINALKGQLLSASQAGDAQKTLTAAGRIGNATGVPEELAREALFLKAKANYSLNNFNEALADFRITAIEVVSASGAESKYRVAEILNMNGQQADAEKMIWEFIDQQSPHQFWMARMFLLLADISIKKGDLLQARATLQSLRDNYETDDDGIQDEVRSKLEALTRSNPQETSNQ